MDIQRRKIHIEFPAIAVKAMLCFNAFLPASFGADSITLAPGVHLYAHCLRDHRGGVAMLAINIDRQAAHNLAAPMKYQRYTLSAKNLQGSSVELNGIGLTAKSKSGPNQSFLAWQRNHLIYTAVSHADFTVVAHKL